MQQALSCCVALVLLWVISIHTQCTISPKKRQTYESIAANLSDESHFSQHFLHDVRVQQVQLDKLFALLGAIKAGEVSETEAIERLERFPHWVWVAMDPESKLLPGH